MSVFRTRSVKQKNGVAFYVVVAVMLLSVLIPILLILRYSLASTADLNTLPPRLIPHSLTLSHFQTVFNDPLFLDSLRNSLIIAGGTTLISLIVGGPAAYALARLRFRLRTTIMAGILAISFFPMVAIIAPLFIEYHNLALIDTYVAVILTDTVFALPLAVWILAAFFRQLPADLEHAAKVDGATTLQTFRLVILPLAAPGVFTAAILTFIATWNEFLFALTFLISPNKWPVTVLIPNYTQFRLVPDYGAQAAAALVVTIPMLLFVLVFQRRIVSGLTAGAVVG
jgi:multiple sugar transport system permease protein